MGPRPYLGGVYWVDNQWETRVQVKLLAFADELNRDVLAARRIEVYYPDTLCLGKDIATLGIRPCEATEMLAMRELTS